MAALKLVMMGVVLVALLGVSPPSVDARSHIPSILTTSESLENIDLDKVLVTDSNLNAKAISEVRSALDTLGINKGLTAGPPCDCGGKDCCDFEICTRSCPPQCRCADVGECCRAGCKNCICTLSIPPQCHCRDITLYTHGACAV